MAVPCTPPHPDPSPNKSPNHPVTGTDVIRNVPLCDPLLINQAQIHPRTLENAMVHLREAWPRTPCRVPNSSQDAAKWPSICRGNLLPTIQ